ncbi:MAG: hypothetical protein ACWGN2_01850 [Anaerolineales bacterium]
MPSFEYDSGYLKEAVELLENYILSKDIYWNLNANSPPGEPGYPALTLGAVLLAEARLQGRDLTEVQDRKLSRLQQVTDRIRAKWRTNWGNKAKEEFRSRLDLWGKFIEDFRRDPKGNFDRYSYEVNRRVMLELLEAEASEIPIVQRELLEGFDKILSAMMVPGEFVWDEKFEAGFPTERFPYLYLTLRD